MATKRASYKKSQSRKPFWESKLEWMLGILKKLLIPALVLWLVAWLWLGGVFAQTSAMVWDQFVEWTASHDLVVEDVVIEGRARMPLSDIQKAVSVKPGDALLSVDIDTIHRNLAKNKWVADVAVRRSYNGVVTITLTERVPFVIWERPGRSMAVVDGEGKVIEGASPKDFQSLLIVKGVDAPNHATELMRMVMAEPVVAEHIRGAEWIGDRRWDLYTAQNVRIHLPEDDMGYALSRLAKAIKDKNILNSSLKSLDLRASDRIIIENKKGQVDESFSPISYRNDKAV